MDTVDRTIVGEYHDIWINRDQRLKQSTKWDGLAFEIGLGTHSTQEDAQDMHICLVDFATAVLWLRFQWN